MLYLVLFILAFALGITSNKKYMHYEDTTDEEVYLDELRAYHNKAVSMM